jgi:hypothetical protein
MDKFEMILHVECGLRIYYVSALNDFRLLCRISRLLDCSIICLKEV